MNERKCELEHGHLRACPELGASCAVIMDGKVAATGYAYTNKRFFNSCPFCGVSLLSPEPIVRKKTFTLRGETSKECPTIIMSLIVDGHTVFIEHAQANMITEDGIQYQLRTLYNELVRALHNEAIE